MKISVYPHESISALPVEHDLAIVSTGYESRGRFAWSTLSLDARERISFLFQSNDVLDYQQNRKYFTDAGFIDVGPNQREASDWISKAAERFFGNLNSSGPWRIVVDISCMTRLLIATLCYEFSQLAVAKNRQLVVDFVYSCAEFGEVPDSSGPITINGPVIPEMAGWPKNPSAPLGLLVGIGYEEDLALGVIEELEATNVWAFRPKDHDPRYEAEIVARNKGLFEEVPPANMVRYSLFDPYSLYSSVEALIGVAKNRDRLVVVPLGPKIFALVSSLAALRHYPNVGLWRVSSGESSTPVQRNPSGQVLGLRAVFEK